MGPFFISRKVVYMELKVEYVPIGAIRPYEHNAKLHPSEQIEQIKNSICEFGMNDPIGVWHEEIVEGHGRLIACKELGYEVVPIIRLDGLTDEQRRAYTLVHNKTTMNSDFNMETLEAELNKIDDIDMDALGFDDMNFSIEEDTPQAQDDGFDEEPPEEPMSKKGNIYRLGRHHLMCGDSCSIDDVEHLTGGKLIDLYLTDPPYNVALGIGGSVDEARERHRRTDGLVIMNDKMDDDSFHQFLVDAFAAAEKVMKPGASFYIWHADNESYNFRGALRDVGLTLRQTLIWNKNTMTLGRQDYQWKHEPCLYGWKDGASHHWYNDRSQTTVIDMDKPSRSVDHPTMKPVPLFAYQIQNSTKPGDMVFDSFGGSGTTLIACEQLERTCYMMELDPRYVDVIIRRWETLTGNKAELLEG